MELAPAGPACDGRREDSRLDVDGPDWALVELDEIGRDLPKCVFDEFMIR